MDRPRMNKFGYPEPPTRQEFFAKVQEFFTAEEAEFIGRAYEFSKAGHYKQERDDGSRYFDHPKTVAWILMTEFGVRDWEVIVDALLHDIREDTYLLKHKCLVINFGLNVACDTDALTKRPEEKKNVGAYIARVKQQGFRTVIVKLADRLHNLRTLGPCTPEKRASTIAETREFVLPLTDYLEQLVPPPTDGSLPLGLLVSQLMLREIARHE